MSAVRVAWPFRLGRGGVGQQGSADVVRERLKAMLMQDRAGTSPQLIGVLRQAILHALEPYVECDPEAAEVAWSRRGGDLAVEARIPLRGVRRPTAER